MSNCTAPQGGEKTPENRQTPGFSKCMVHDSFSYSISSPSPSEEKPHRFSRQHLEEVSTRLSDRDKQVLTTVQRYRYLLTGQIQRLYFYGAKPPAVAHRAAARALRRLKDLGLLDHLARRIGGVRAGSGGLVWHLTHVGERLLYLKNHVLTPTKRFSEPSPYFLAHTLAVTDIAVQLTELCREQRTLKLTALQPEPECWRTFSEYGAIQSLKLGFLKYAAPDLSEQDLAHFFTHGASRNPQAPTQT